MKVLVQRNVSDGNCTLSTVYIDTVFYCYGLEPPIREVAGQPVAEWKVDGNTAIPAGTYDLSIDFSPHFNRMMPHVLNVPGFSGVRIHPGNTVSDTEACLLLGEVESKDAILQSRAAFDGFFSRLNAAFDAGEPCIITYINPPQP